MKRSWIGWASGRLLSGRKGGRGRTAFVLSVLGIALGVMTLNAVLGVMNGFQRGFIRNILEIGSYHVRWIPDKGTGTASDGREALAEVFAGDDEVVAVVPFREGQTLLRGALPRPAGALVRGVPEDLLLRDLDLAERLKIVDGDFDIRGNGAVLGVELARDLGVLPGDDMIALALGGPGFAPEEINVRVTGLFRCGYLEYDSSLVFVGKELVSRFLGEAEEEIGLKLRRPELDRGVMARLEPAATAAGGRLESWRESNRAFFGALRTEKTMMMLLVGLVFVVVAVNIENALRRLAAERLEEIAVMKASGASPGAVRLIFLRQGLILGGFGGLVGTAAGILVATNVNGVFRAVEAVVNGVASLLGRILPYGVGSFRVYPGDAFYIASVPSEVLPGDVALVWIVATTLAVVAAWRASARAARVRPALILRSE